MLVFKEKKAKKCFLHKSTIKKHFQKLHFQELHFQKNITRSFNAVKNCENEQRIYWYARN